MQSELEVFQTFINTVLIRNKSVLDQSTKLQDACTHINRTISKAATTCGCISIEAHKQPYLSMQHLEVEDFQQLLSTHINGKLCPSCQEALEKEMGRLLFYLGSLANTFNLSLSDVLQKEQYHTELLGKFSLR